MATVTRSTATYTVETSVSNKLRAIRARKVVLGLSAVGLVAATLLIVGMLAAMLIDGLTLPGNAVLRPWLTAVPLILTAAALIAGVVYVLKRERLIGRAAADVDAANPSLEQRWSTLTNVAERGERERPHPAMYRQLTKEAAAFAPRVQPGRVIRLRYLLCASAGCLVAVGLLVAACAWDFERTIVLAARFWAPRADITLTRFEGLPAELFAAQGESMALEAQLRGRVPPSALLELRDSDGKVSRHELGIDADDNGLVGYRISDVDKSFSFRWQAGDARTAWLPAEVVRRPKIAALRLIVTPPAYTRQPVVRRRELPSRVRVVEGSTLELAIQPAESIAEMQLKNSVLGDASIKGDADGWYRWRTTVTEDFSFTPTLVEPHGLTDRRPGTCRVQLHRDQAPKVKVVSPTAEMAVQPNEEVEIEFIASDDFAVDRAELVVTSDPDKEGEEPKELRTIPIDLGNMRGSKKLNGTVTLDLSEFELKDGQSISYTVRVYDNRVGPAPPTDEPSLAAHDKTPAAASPSATARSGSSQGSNSAQGSRANGSPDSPNASTAQAGSPSGNSKSSGARNDSAPGGQSPQGKTPPIDAVAAVEGDGNTGATYRTPDAELGAGVEGSAGAGPEGASERNGNRQQPNESDAASQPRERQGDMSATDRAQPQGAPSSATAGANEPSGSSSRASDAGGESSANVPNGARSESAASPNSGSPNSATPTSAEAGAQRASPSGAASGDANASSRASDSPADGQSATPSAGRDSATAHASGKMPPEPTSMQTESKPGKLTGSPNGAPKNGAESTAVPRDVDTMKPGMPPSEGNAGKAQGGNAPGGPAGDSQASSSAGAPQNPNGGAPSSAGAGERESDDAGMGRAEMPAPPEDAARDPLAPGDAPNAKEMPDADSAAQPSDEATSTMSNPGNLVVSNSAGEQKNQTPAGGSSGPQGKVAIPEGSVPLDPGGEKKNGAEEQKDPAASNSAGTPEPGDQMTTRMLDLPQSSSSSEMQIKIDEWAGSFDGQQREKLALAISPVLVRLSEILTEAEKLTDGVAKKLESGAAYDGDLQRYVNRAEKSLRSGEKLVEELKETSKDTPYAFIGLQLGLIGQTHIAPARDSLWEAQDAAGSRIELVRSAWQEIVRAQTQLEELTKTFDRVHREHRLAESTQKIKKMYRVYLEDALALLGPEEGGIHNYESRPVEFNFDEEYLKRLKEVMEMRRDLQKELARLLSDDPRLMRRFMDRAVSRGDTMRDQLTLLGERQKQQTREVQAWVAADEVDRPALLATLKRLRQSNLVEIAQAAAAANEKFVTWMPLNLTAGDPALEEVSTQFKNVAAAAALLSATAVEDPSRFEKAQKLYEQLGTLDAALRQVDRAADDEALADHLLNRLADVRRLTMLVSSWLRQADYLEKGNYWEEAAIEQYKLAMEVDKLAGKLADAENEINGAVQPASGETDASVVGEKYRALLKMLDKELAANQLAATFALRHQQSQAAVDKATAAVTAFEKAEVLFDELMRAVIDERDKLPVQDPIASLLDDPTLDEMLAELENESRLDEILGIPTRPSNLRTIGDWIRPNNRGGGGGNMQRMMMAKMRRDANRGKKKAEEAHRRAISQALKEQEKIFVGGRKARPADTRRVEWNTLISTLGEELLQGKGKLPPQEYRQAIEQYLTRISRIENGSEGEAAPAADQQ